MGEPLVVLGAGLAGLSAAYHLGGDVPVYEQSTSVGGLCRQVHMDGFQFDVVPHVLHFSQDEVRRLVEALSQSALVAYSRQARVWSHGAYTRYPFQAHLFGLPDDVVQECLRGRLKAQAQGTAETGTFERWVESTFGAGIARHFFMPYNEKFWTVPPAELTCEWVEGLIPVPTYEETLRGAWSDDPTEYGYNVTFWYPQSGGLGTLLKGFIERLPRVMLGKRLVRLDTAAHRLHFADGHVVAYDQLMSSLPLPELRSVLHPLPPDVAHALDALRWTSLIVVHLGVAGPPAVPWDWVYVPDPAVSFYRVGFPSRYATDAVPEGSHLICAELASSAWRPIDQTTIIPRVIQELRQLGLLQPSARVAMQVASELRYGYPLYDRHHAWATALLRSHLEQRGVIPLGRFGSWRYLSMEETLLDGQRAARQVFRQQSSSDLSCEPALE